MKISILTLLLTFVSLNLSAQTGWQQTAEDQQSLKLNFIEDGDDGTVFNLRYDYTQPHLTCMVIRLDSTGNPIATTSIFIPGQNPAVKSFQADTVLKRILVIAQYEDSSSYYMHMMVLNYSLQPVDSSTFGLSKSSIDRFVVCGGGIDYAVNKFIVYNYRDINDQIWGRGICRKNISGTYKTNVFKAGQASNDGIFINACTVAPAGYIYIGGARKESLYGNFVFFEKVNASLVTMYEVKDQLVANNTFTNHVSDIHVYTNNANSQVVFSGTIFGLAPGDTIYRSHGFIKAYTATGTLRWTFQNYEVKDYKKVIAKNSFVHAVGTNNSTNSGLDTRISRVFLKDGVSDWNRYYAFKSIPSALRVEDDGSLLIAGDKQISLTFPTGSTITTRSYMLARYSKYGKRLYDYNHTWSPLTGTTSITAGMTDLITSRSGFYYSSGWERTQYDIGGGLLIADSTRILQFTNGAIRFAPDVPLPNDKLVIRPNPAKNEITFDSELQVTDFMIVSSAGNLVEIEELHQDGTTYHCNVSKLSSGMYIIKVRTERGWKNARFMKE